MESASCGIVSSMRGVVGSVGASGAVEVRMVQTSVGSWLVNVNFENACRIKIYKSNNAQ